MSSKFWIVEKFICKILIIYFLEPPVSVALRIFCKLASSRASQYFNESLPAIEPHVSLSTVDITVIA